MCILCNVCDKNIYIYLIIVNIIHIKTNTINFIASTMKGKNGEQKVLDTLQELYSTSRISKTGKYKTGDIIFIQNELKCMIEVKNKSVINHIDVAKFIRDVIEHCRYKTINCALFVSMNQSYLYDKTTKKSNQFYAELLCNIPIIYISAENANSKALKIAIDYLLSLPVTQSKPNPIVYKSADIIATKTQSYFEQSEIPKELDKIDTDAFIYIRSVLANLINNEDTSVFNETTKERARYMILEHLLPKSKLLIVSALNIKFMTEKHLTQLNILSKTSIHMIKKLGAFSEIVHYCDQEKLYPSVIEVSK